MHFDREFLKNILYRLFRSSGEMALVPDFFNVKSVFCVEDFV